MNFYKLCPREYFGSNTYVIVSGEEAAVVDPSVPFSEAESLLSGVRLKYILLTHCHFDHILTLDEWVEKTGAEVVIGRHDAAGLKSPITNCYRLFLGREEGYFGSVTEAVETDAFRLGESDVRVIYTPGHTAGGVSYLADRTLFAGDTVFAGGGYGRCDLPGGDMDLLFESITMLCNLDADIKVCPGHGEDTTISELRRNFK